MEGGALSLRYAQIERAVARLHQLDVDDVAVMKTFRTRVRNFNKIGLAPSSPGKGNKASYTDRDAFFWAFCFELTEAGLPPAMIKTVMDAQGNVVLKHLTRSAEAFQAEQADRYFFISADFLLWRLSEEVAGALAKHAAGIRTLEEISRTATRRMILINLTSLHNEMTKSLALEGY